MTSYAAAKFAVKGFTEALITELEINAPHIGCSVVMPGAISTALGLNGMKILHGEHEGNLRYVRMRRQADRDAYQNMSDDEILAEAEEVGAVPGRATSAEGAARIILDGVRTKRWRILVGRDA